MVSVGRSAVRRARFRLRAPVAAQRAARIRRRVRNAFGASACGVACCSLSGLKNSIKNRAEEIWRKFNPRACRIRRRIGLWGAERAAGGKGFGTGRGVRLAGCGIGRKRELRRQCRVCGGASGKRGGTCGISRDSGGGKGRGSGRNVRPAGKASGPVGACAGPEKSPPPEHIRRRARPAPRAAVRRS